MNKFVYVVTSTFDSDEKNYEIGTYIDGVFKLKKDANKKISELKKEHKKLDACVTVYCGIDKVKLT